jgi:ABC-type dipeptide/oligopeptide/nickel transport system permease component
VLPVLTMNQAIVVAQAIESREAQMARAVGLPALLTWRSILLPRSLPFWRTQASLLLVGLFEGPILIERAFGFSDGLGSIAFGAALSSDKPLLLLLVGLTCTLVNLGVLACVTFGVEGHAGRVARRRVYAAR